MKKVQYILITALLIAGLSCKKDDTITVTGNVSSSEAADIMGSSLAANSGGVASISDDASTRSQHIADSTLSCGSTVKDTVTSVNQLGASTSFTYGLGFSNTLNCNALALPDNISGKLNYSGNFNGPQISSRNTGTSTYTVAGLSKTAANYVFNGTFVRAGSFTVKVDSTNKGTSVINVIIKDLTLSKPNLTIVSGTGTFTLTGNVPKKGNFSFNGSITFNGDGSVQVTIGGTPYKIDVATAVRIKS